MLIELSRGLTTEIDDADWPIVAQYKWKANKARGSFYAISRYSIDGVRKHVLMHRLLLGVFDRNVLVDHKDNNSLNNRRSNLRTCTHAENMRNSKVRAHSKSGVKNVSYIKVNGVMRWVATVRLNGKRHRKSFWNIEDATACAIAMRERLHGDFAAPLGVTTSKRNPGYA